MTVMSVADVTLGLAEWLDIQGFGTYKPIGAYAPDEDAVTVRGLPPSPDRALAVAPYGVQDTTNGLPTTTTMIQLRFRGSPGDMTSADKWADQVAQHLHGAQQVALPNGLVIQRAVRTIVAPLGPDENNRPERADSYQLLFMLPT